MTPPQIADDASDVRSYVTALARGLAVVRAFSHQPHPLSAADVARLVGLPRATVRRSLITLQQLGYVTCHNGRTYGLTPQVLMLAEAYLSSSMLPRVAQPFLERVSDTLGESCSLSILHGTQVVYVARSSRKRMASLHRDVGTHLPAHCTSMGRVLLASLSTADLDRYFAEATLESFTPYTIVQPDALRPVLAKVIRDGYCIVDRELEAELRGIAVPVQNAQGRAVAALNVSTQASVTPRRVLTDRVLKVLRGAAAEMRPLLVN